MYHLKLNTGFRQNFSCDSHDPFFGCSLKNNRKKRTSCKFRKRLVRDKRSVITILHVAEDGQAAGKQKYVFIHSRVKRNLKTCNVLITAHLGWNCI